MRSRLSIGVIALALALFPASAIAAEKAAEGGSWLRLLFFAINFTVFILIVVRFAAPVVRKFFADRAAEIRGTLSRSDEALQAAQALASSEAQRMAALGAEKARIQAEFDAETAHQVRIVRELAQVGAERIKRDAEMTAAAIAESAERRLRNRVAALATQIARDLISRNLKPADQGKLLTGFVRRLSQEART
jgi:F0F1-type ATP synthase membrane subunit b/b'